MNYYLFIFRLLLLNDWPFSRNRFLSFLSCLMIYCFFSIFSLIFCCLLVHFFYVFAILVVIRFFFDRSFAQLSFVDFFNSHICYESAIFLFPPFSLFLVIRFSMVKQQQQQLQQLCNKLSSIINNFSRKQEINRRKESQKQQQ